MHMDDLHQDPRLELEVSHRLLVHFSGSLESQSHETEQAVAIYNIKMPLRVPYNTDGLNATSILNPEMDASDNSGLPQIQDGSLAENI